MRHMTANNHGSCVGCFQIRLQISTTPLRALILIDAPFFFARTPRISLVESCWISSVAGASYKTWIGRCLTRRSNSFQVYE